MCFWAQRRAEYFFSPYEELLVQCLIQNRSSANVYRKNVSSHWHKTPTRRPKVSIKQVGTIGERELDPGRLGEMRVPSWHLALCQGLFMWTVQFRRFKEAPGMLTSQRMLFGNRRILWQSESWPCFVNPNFHVFGAPFPLLMKFSGK